MITIIVIILLFASLVLLHEFGHYLVARRGGVEAEEFGIGFPPRVYGRKIGKTLFSLNLLPLGGFVRLKGEDAADMGPGTFGGAKFSTQAKIVLAGVVVNVVTAIVLMYALCVTGLPGLGGQFEPSFLHSTYAQPKQLLLVDVVPGSPAAQAGLVRGDIIVSANGKAMSTDTQLHNFTLAQAGKTVTLGVTEKGAAKTLQVTLLPPSATNGYLGVDVQQVYKLRYDPLRAIVAAVYITAALIWATLVGIFSLILSIPILIAGLFHHGVPSQAESTGGPIYIVYLLQNLSKLGWSYVILFIANISVALATFNVLPLPALDGGRLFVLAVQKITGKKWSANAEARYHATGFVALIALMVLISVYDIRKITG